MAFVLGDVQNHLDGAGRPDHGAIALAVHGPALKAFHPFEALPDSSAGIGQFAKAGLQLVARGNTLKAPQITLADLLPGSVEAGKMRRDGDRRAAVAGISFTSGPDFQHEARACRGGTGGIGACESANPALGFALDQSIMNGVIRRGSA